MNLSTNCKLCVHEKMCFLKSLNFSSSLVQDCKTPLNTSRPNWYAHNKFDRMPRLPPASCEFLWNQKYIVFTYTCTLKSLTYIFFFFWIFLFFSRFAKAFENRPSQRNKSVCTSLLSEAQKNSWYRYISLPNKLKPILPVWKLLNCNSYEAKFSWAN